MHIPRESRRKVLIRAKMRAGGPRVDVCIRDVSSRGLLIQGSAAPPRGTYVEFTCADQWIVGRVVWGKDRRFGVSTRERVDVGALLGGAPAGARAPSQAAPPARPLPAARTEALRPLARAMEFAMVGLFAATLVAALGAAAFGAMAGPFQTVSRLTSH